MFTDFFMGIFSPFGIVGLVILVGVAAYLDAMMFPMMPELFVLLAYLSAPEPKLLWGAIILITIVLTESAGMTTLYLITEKVTVMQRVKKVALKYLDLMVISDERIVLMCRIVPVVPFIGAFISYCNWSYKKAIGYNILGCAMKYSVLMAFAGTLAIYFETGVAGDITIALVIAVVAISIAINVAIDKMRKSGEKPGKILGLLFSGKGRTECKISEEKSGE